jgi:hypothetical protein
LQEQQLKLQHKSPEGMGGGGGGGGGGGRLTSANAPLIGEVVSASPGRESVGMQQLREERGLQAPESVLLGENTFYKSHEPWEERGLQAPESVLLLVYC